MKKLIIIVGVMFGSLLITRRVLSQPIQKILEPFSNVTKTEVIVLSEALDLSTEYKEVRKELEQANEIDSSLILLMRDSLESIYDEYLNLITQMNLYSQFIEDSIIKIDPHTGEYLNKTELTLNAKYWMGNHPQSHKGRGNGKAKELRDRLNDFCLTIKATNEQISSIAGRDEWYIPEFVNDQEVRNELISWEKFTFDGPVVANLAFLEAIKIDQSEIVKSEFEFYQEIIKKAP